MWLDQFTSVSGATVVSTSGLSMDGNYCLEMTGSGDRATYTLPSGISEAYFAFLYRATTIGNENVVLSVLKSSVLVGQLRLTINGYPKVYSSSTLLATAATPLVTNTTYLIEIYYTIADSGGKFSVKINGISAIDFTGDTKPGTDTTFDNVYFGSQGSNYGYAYYDNIILDSANWIGKTYIQGLAPTGAGTTTQLTPSAGSNYACVDEIPASDTDYVYSNTVDQLDTYAAGNLTGTIGTIKAVQVQSRVVKEGTATPQNVKLAVRSGATDYVSADKVVPTTAATVASIWETDPATSAAWSEANVNAVEIGVKTAA